MPARCSCGRSTAARYAADANVSAAVQIMAGILTVRTITEMSIPEPSEVDSLVDLVLRGVGSLR